MRTRRVRRVLALGVVGVGLSDLVSALVPPSRDNLTFVLRFAPLVVVQGAAAFLALVGLVLVGVAPGLRRGQRQAWGIACVALAAGAMVHVAHGVEAVQGTASLAVLALLVARRADFAAVTDRRTRRSAGLLAGAGLVAVVALASASIEVFLALDPDAVGPLAPADALVAVAGRLVGVQAVALPARLNRFVTPSLESVGLVLALLAVVACTRPIVERRRASDASHRDARALIGRHGAGTLDYFALRHDKAHFFTGDTLVTYAVLGGVCLVSPDPIGPADEREATWAEFCRFADGRGWVVAVLGADDAWLPTYRRAGMRPLYIGDEAVVSVDGFDLAGGHRKGLRQAVNRIARYGYTVNFCDPCHLDADTERALRAISDTGRRGEQERGFSMTLGRLFDPQDEGLLLAVARDRDTNPVAFCQFVPAPAIGGYSLDLMRRDTGPHPNGLIDFVLVSTIEHLRGLGFECLGLNFATLRAVLAGESGQPALSRLCSWGLRHLSRSMQIESLWRFCAKYDPTWVRRHLVFGSIEHCLPVGLAVARAESFVEMPVVGRYFGPGRRPAGERGAAA